MVLSRHAARVLAVVAVLALAAGCGESLFDAHAPLDAGNGDVPTSCPETCLADAAANYGATPPGADRWQYLDDHRDRTWAPMTVTAGDEVGADPANTISSCARKPDAAACKALHGALLVSTAGAGAAADPAIVYTSASAQVLELDVVVRVPAGQPDQLVRIYRNSREDVLFTAAAVASATFHQEITVDALPGDRFFVALAPTSGGAVDIGVHVFVSATSDMFPRACQLAVPFSMASGNTVANLCGAPGTHFEDATGANAPVLAVGPFAELGPAADLARGTYFESPGILDKSADVTVQLWMRNDMLVNSNAAFAFSDLDLDIPGGLSIDLFQDDNGATQLEAFTATMVDPSLEFNSGHAPWPGPGWHFVRVVHRDDTIELCIDGALATSFAAARGSLASTQHPYLGRNVMWTPTGSFYDGGIDDVRVFTGALPCN